MNQNTIDLFPRDFVWGVSTAAYQIEGATTAGGRGRSSWDAFVAEPGRITNGDTGDTACDRYHRYPEDIALMKELGVDAYRFSFSWSRIQPGGRGAVNAAGLGFYDKLVDGLLEAGIQPSPTLFHWDTPLELEQAGGWLNRDTAEHFAEYAAILGGHFADRIPRWITINEPAALTLLGYGAGIHAPGLALGFDALTNRMFPDPILTGAYSEALAPFLPPLPDGDLATISTPIDWYSINSYNPVLVGAPTPGGAALIDGHALDVSLPFELRELKRYPRTDFDWPVVPDALTDLLLDFKDYYDGKLPLIVITENGAAYNVGPDRAGGVPDAQD